jgi:hypothetical protein
MLGNTRDHEVGALLNESRKPYFLLLFLQRISCADPEVGVLLNESQKA